MKKINIPSHSEYNPSRFRLCSTSHCTYHASPEEGPSDRESDNNVRLVLEFNESNDTDHKRCNSVLKQVVDQIRVPLDSFRVDRVVATPQGDDARPSDRKAVRFDSIFDKESDIFFPKPIGVGRDIAVTSIEGLSRLFREVVPD